MRASDARRENAVDADDLYTPREVAERLRCDAKTIRRYVRIGLLDAVRLQRRVLIPARAVDQLLAARAVRAGK